jgi:hypothetical protein
VFLSKKNKRKEYGSLFSFTVYMNTRYKAGASANIPKRISGDFARWTVDLQTNGRRCYQATRHPLYNGHPPPGGQTLQGQGPGEDAAADGRPRSRCLLLATSPPPSRSHHGARQSPFLSALDAPQCRSDPICRFSLSRRR